jgi:hypothetical protein
MVLVNLHSTALLPSFWTLVLTWTVAESMSTWGVVTNVPHWATWT